MPKAATTGQSGVGAVRPRTTSLYLACPLAGLVYALIVHHLIIARCSPIDTACNFTSRPDNKILWPALALISLVLVGSNWRRFSVPTNIAWLLAFVAFAGLSVVWAYRIDLSATRYAQQVMIVTAVVLPALIMTDKGDLLRGMFLCFALASVINVFFLFGPPPALATQATPGAIGYFQGKNYLAICAAMALLLSMHEMTYPGSRRYSGIIIGIIAGILLYLSNGKTSTGLVIASPIIAAVAVFLRRKLGLSVLVIPVSVLAVYFVASLAPTFNVYKISYWIYSDSTFTGRRALWEFALQHIASRPIHGWGYQSFWLVGADAPSVTTAVGWIKTMPNAHSGYLDTVLEMGYVGLGLLLAFVASTLHAASRLIDRDPVRGWIVVTLAFYLIITNFLETMWMRGYEFPWLVFLILAAEVGRNLQRERVSVHSRRAIPALAARAERRTPHNRSEHGHWQVPRRHRSAQNWARR